MLKHIYSVKQEKIFNSLCFEKLSIIHFCQFCDARFCVCKYKNLIYDNRIWRRNRSRMCKCDFEQIKKKIYVFILFTLYYLLRSSFVFYFMDFYGMFDLGRILNSNFNLFYIENLILNQTYIE